MTLDPTSLMADLDRLENIEKASLRHVVQAICDFRDEAIEVFAREDDKAQDIAEDITREALDRMGTATIPTRLFGKVDYKRARYLFHEKYAVQQALFVDSKAEKGGGSARLQVGQTSLTIRQRVNGVAMEVPGGIPPIRESEAGPLLTTTIFVKYNYKEPQAGRYELRSITIIALPNGMLQDRYNRDVDHGFWNVGPNAPSRGEEFRTRIGIVKLKQLASWRVQRIVVASDFVWDD